ncbi:MAG: amino acid racemase, partial [Phycisphaerae bacterium]|nr:amino acid racemase [Phycisphaerae bacterium]
MKLLGIVGGLGPESTIEYYKEIFRVYRERIPDGPEPSFILNSVDVKTAVRLVTAGDLDGLANYMAEAVTRLAKAGADFGLISANTPHIVFDRVQRLSTIPLLSIVEAACDETKRRGLKRVALFGTRFTMQGSFYRDVFTREGVELVAPSGEEQDFVHHIYMNELLNGIVRDETRTRLIEIAETMRRRDGIEGLLLAGT